MIINIGVDLSTTKTGIVAMKIGDNSYKNGYYTFNKILIDNTNMKTINSVDKNFKLHIKSLIDSLQLQEQASLILNIGIEISNFSNPKLTQKFSLYAGMIISFFNELLPNINFKWFNSNQWQYLIGCKVSDERNVRKQKAKEWASQFENVEHWEQDEIDAFCIAKLLFELKTTDEIKQETKQKKIDKHKETANQLKLQKMVNTRLMEINRLDKVKNAKRIETLKKEIEQLGYDMEKRAWK